MQDNGTISLHEAMQEDGFPVGKMHGKLSESVRKDTSRKFQKGVERVLICSDLYARGIDVQQVSIVINPLPSSACAVLHPSYACAVRKQRTTKRSHVAVCY